MSITEIRNEELALKNNYTEVEENTVKNEYKKHLKHFDKRLNSFIINLPKSDTRNDVYDNDYEDGYTILDLALVKRIIQDVETLKRGYPFSLGVLSLIITYNTYIIPADALTISILEQCLFLWRKEKVYVDFRKNTSLIEKHSVNGFVYYYPQSCSTLHSLLCRKYLKSEAYPIDKQLDDVTFYSWFEGDSNRTKLISKSKNEVTHICNKCIEFLSNNGIPEQINFATCEIIGELVANANEHGETNCVIDLCVEDISLGKIITLVIFDFSQKLLWTDLEDKIFLNPDTGSCTRPERIETVRKSRENHAPQFSDWYKLDDFRNIMCFQKISGRKDARDDGGTGLETLILNLRDLVDQDFCYVLSGNHCLYFLKDYMDEDEDGYMGFNEDKDFLSKIPFKNCVDSTEFYMPGVAYSFTFSV